MLCRTVKDNSFFVVQLKIKLYWSTSHLVFRNIHVVVVIIIIIVILAYFFLLFLWSAFADWDSSSYIFFGSPGASPRTSWDINIFFSDEMITSAHSVLPPPLPLMPAVASWMPGTFTAPVQRIGRTACKKNKTILPTDAVQTRFWFNYRRGWKKMSLIITWLKTAILVLFLFLFL